MVEVHNQIHGEGRRVFGKKTKIDLHMDQIIQKGPGQSKQGVQTGGDLEDFCEVFCTLRRTVEEWVHGRLEVVGPRVSSCGPTHDLMCVDLLNGRLSMEDHGLTYHLTVSRPSPVPFLFQSFRKGQRESCVVTIRVSYSSLRTINFGEGYGVFMESLSGG